MATNKNIVDSDTRRGHVWRIRSMSSRGTGTVMGGTMGGTMGVGCLDSCSSRRRVER